MTETCLSPQELDRLAGGACPGAASSHLSECCVCREALSAARRDEALFSELRVLSHVECDLPDDAIPGYRLLRELHRGGHGSVHLAAVMADDTYRAIKIERSGWATSARQRARFEREIALSKSLDHPHIVPVVDSGWCGEQRWFAMPFIEGRELDVWVRETQPELPVRLRLFVAICRAVGHAHRRGVIHRDLKPSNLLVNAAGQPRILDFGVAKVPALDEPSLTLTNQFTGTPAYASPEQLRADAEVTTGTDVYSLGVILFELSTGEMPYSVEGSFAAIATSVMQSQPRSPRPPEGKCDWSLRAILSKSLEKCAGDRYASADALAEDVERLLAGDPISHGRSPKLYLLRKFMGRHRRALALSALALTIVIGGLAAILYLQVRAVTQRETAAQIQVVLRDILQAASPTRMGGSAPLFQVLELAASRIEGALDASPDVQAGIQYTIGETYLDLLMFAEAERHLSLARERYAELDDEPPVMLAQTLHKLGVAASRRNDRRSVDWLQQSLRLHLGMYREDDPRLLVVQRDAAWALISHPDQLDDDSARGTFEKVLPIFERVCGAHHPEVGQTLHALSDWYLARQDAVASERYLRRAAEIFSRPENESSPYAIRCFNQLADLMLAKADLDPDRFEEVEELLERSSVLAKRLFGGAQATAVLRQISRYHFSRGQFEVSQRFALESVIHDLGVWAQRRPGDRERLQELAAGVARVPGSPDSHQAVLESFRWFREYRGRGAYELAGWLNGLAQLERQLKRPRRAIALVRESLEFDCRVLGRDCPKRYRALVLLASELIDLEDTDTARDHLLEAQAILERTNRTQMPLADELQKLLAACDARGARRR